MTMSIASQIDTHVRGGNAEMSTMQRYDYLPNALECSCNYWPFYIQTYSVATPINNDPGRFNSPRVGSFRTTRSAHRATALVIMRARHSRIMQMYLVANSSVNSVPLAPLANTSTFRRRQNFKSLLNFNVSRWRSADIELRRDVARTALTSKPVHCSMAHRYYLFI